MFFPIIVTEPVEVVATAILWLLDAASLIVPSLKEPLVVVATLAPSVVNPKVPAL